MGEIKQWYERDFTLEQAMRCIDENLKASVRNFVAVGFYLKSIRDQKLYQDDDCQNFEEFVRKHYDRDKGWASRCIKVNDQLSKDGNSPVLADEYKDYKVSQLVELAYLTDEQRILAKPDMTVKEIKAIRQPAAKSQPEPEVVISQLDLGEKVVTSQPEEAAKTVTVQEAEAEEQQPKTGKCYHRPEFDCTLEEVHKLTAGDGEDCAQKCCWNCGYHGDCNLECYSSAKRPEAPEMVQPEEQRSAYGTPKRIYPEDSLLTTQGCEGGHDCISCHLECDIRQHDCYCVEAPMGNPFPCEMVGKIPELREITGVDCQFINLDLAYHRVGDNGPVPCCKKCTVHCEYICERAMKALGERAAAVADKSPEEAYRPVEEEKIDESYNIGDLPQAKESLLRQLAKALVNKCGSQLVLAEVGHNWTDHTIKNKLRYIDQQDNGITLQDGIEAFPSAEIIEFFRGEEDLGVCTYARFETQARKALDEWVRAGKSQDKPAPEPEPPKEVIDAEFAEIPVEQAEDIYDSDILANMIKQMQDGLDLMADRWRESQPWTYKKYRMAVEAYKMYQAAHERGGSNEN